MPNEVIDRVHKLARRSAAALTFADRDRVVIPDDDDDDDNDSDYAPDAAAENDNDDGIEYDDIAGVFDEDGDDDDDGVVQDNNHYPMVDVALMGESEQSAQVEPAMLADGIEEGADDEVVNIDPEHDVTEHNDDDHIDAIDEDAEPGADEEDKVNDDNAPPELVAREANVPSAAIEDVEAPVQHNDEMDDERYGRYDLRPRRPRDYAHLYAILEHTVFTQLSMRRGLAEYGDAGVQAVLKGLLQLHDRRVLEPKQAHQLTREEKRTALQYLMFLKKKRNGIIKGRDCADGQKQRAYTTKEEASSPTVAIKAVMLSCIIVAKEHRDVATVDLPGVFMQADVDEVVHMRMEGKMAELLVRINPQLYRKYIVIEGNKNVLYVELRKALYGTLKAALLLWRLLTARLVVWDFKPNPYDSCVMNKDINGNQCTILWHVDDLKISHVNPAVVTSMIELLKSEFGKESPLTKTRGKVHEYLDMTIDFSEDGKVKFTTIDYFDDMLEVLPNDMAGEAATPASKFLFKVNKDATKLDSDTGNLFHHNTA